MQPGFGRTSGSMESVAAVNPRVARHDEHTATTVRMLALGLLTCAIGLSPACGNDPHAPVPDALLGGEASETSAEPEPLHPPFDSDDAIVCGEGSHPVDSRCETDLTWTEGAALSAGRDHHGTVIAEVDGLARLVVIGGWDGRHILGDVVAADIRPDGTLGAFAPTDALPFGVSGAAVGAIDDVIVVATGMRNSNGFRRVASTFVGRLTGDGIAWTTGNDVPDAVFHASLATSSNRFYVSGGFNGVTSVDTVVVATLGADGTVSSWQPTTPLPQATSHHSSFVSGDWLYTVGGLTGDPARDPTEHADVRRAPIGPDGLLGAWESLASLPASLVAHSSAVFGDEVWTFGGVKEGHFFTREIMRAQLRADGTLGPWAADAAGLPVARAHVHHTPVRGRHIYSVGGRTEDAAAQPFVWLGRFQ